MTPEQRINLVRYIWTTLLITIAGIIILAGNSLGGLIIPIIIFLVGGAIPISGFVLNFGNTPQVEDAGKAKRSDKLENILQRLSDEDLEALRRHLTYEEEPYGIGEDGELMYMENRS